MSAPVLPPTTPRTPLWALGLFVAVFCALSVWFGPDASWDLRNYHLYDAHAALSGTLWRDIAPAQLQSFYDPALDVVRLLLLRALNAHPAALGMVLALPHALAAWLALGIALRVGLPPGVALAAILLGATGAAGLPTLGTAMSEMVPGCSVVAGLGLVCRAAPADPCSPRHPRKNRRNSVPYAWIPAFAGMTENRWRGFCTGLLTGAALALKLTFAAYAPAVAASLVAAGRRRWLPAFASGVTVATLVLGGPWWWTVWRHTGNPLFPYFNEIFRSAWALSVSMTDTRFLPTDAFHTVLFPLFWAIQPSQIVSELPVRDPRLALAWVGWLVVIARAARRREMPAAPVRALLAFWVVGFVAWEACFSILRYTATLELLAGIPIALALAPLRVRTVVVFAAIAAFTIYPDWGRARPGPLAADVHPPAFPPHSLVLLLDPAPMAYVAAFSAPGVRFVGVNSNLVHPGGGTALARAAAAAVQRHDGLLWGLESPADQPGQADRTLAVYGLVRGAPCERVRSNLDADAILACPLLRVQSSPRQAMISRPSAPNPRLMAMPASASSTSAANMRGISSR